MTMPLSLMGKYQLVVLGAQGDSQVSDCVGRLETALGLSFSYLGVDPKKFLARVMSETPGPDRRMPSVAVFFGLVSSPSLSTDDAQRLDDLLTDGVLIIPVVADAGHFSTFVPGNLCNSSSDRCTDLGTPACGV
jgi:hypothetical protein